MTDEELNAIGKGIMLHLQRACPTPGDALSVMVYIVLMLYQHKPEEFKGSVEDFMKGFSEHVVSTWKHNMDESVPTEYKIQ